MDLLAVPSTAAVRAGDRKKKKKTQSERRISLLQLFSFN